MSYKLKRLIIFIFTFNLVFIGTSQSLQKSSYSFTFKSTTQNNNLATSGQIAQETNQTNLKLGYLPLNTSFLLNKLYFKKNIQIFPNPFSDKITLQLPDYSNVKRISIYSTNGAIVFQKSNEINQLLKIQVENLTQGLYFVKIQFIDNTIQTKKLIKL